MDLCSNTCPTQLGSLTWWYPSLWSSLWSSCLSLPWLSCCCWGDICSMKLKVTQLTRIEVLWRQPPWEDLHPFYNSRSLVRGFQSNCFTSNDEKSFLFADYQTCSGVGSRLTRWASLFILKYWECTSFFSLIANPPRARSSLGVHSQWRGSCPNDAHLRILGLCRVWPKPGRNRRPASFISREWTDILCLTCEWVGRVKSSQESRLFFPLHTWCVCTYISLWMG